MSGLKTRTIKAAIRAKLNAWINTIEDGAVRDAVRKDAIVTGGSIASMLLGEPVKDYDVYFKTQATAIIVANYYVNKFVEGRDGWGEPEIRVCKIKNLNGDIEDVVQVKMKNSRHSAYEHGEASPEAAQEHVAEEIIAAASGTEEDNLISDMEAKSTKKYWPVYVSENAITLTDKIQIVLRFTGTAQQIHQNYDFAHCKNVYDLDADELVLDQLALECLLSKTLRYTGSLYPLCSIFRAKKFIERGWRISAGELLKIAYQTSRIDFNDMEQLREQLVGVDALYFAHLMSAIQKKVETEGSVVEAVLIDLIDEVFNS